MDITSQIQNIVIKHQRAVADEVSQLLGGASGIVTRGGEVAAAAVINAVTAQSRKSTKAKSTKAKSTKAKAPKAPKARAPKTRAAGEKRDPAVLEQLVEQLFSYIKENPGQRIEAIATGLGVETKSLNLPIKKLRKADRISTKGQKRATTYHAD